jgi:hypothetical protein
VNGKRAKAFRAALGHKRPPIVTARGGLFERDGRWFFQQREVPMENVYRGLKRRYIRGELG